MRAFDGANGRADDLCIAKVGRQCILVNAGGACTPADRRDYILAYALPKRQ